MTDTGPTLSTQDGTPVSREKIDEIRGSDIIQSLVRPLHRFLAVKDDVFEQAVILSTLAQTPDQAVSFDDLEKISEWAAEVQQKCILFELFLIGAIDVRVINNEITFRATGGSPKDMIRQLELNGFNTDDLPSPLKGTE